jgi:hypothetical protein
MLNGREDRKFLNSLKPKLFLILISISFIMHAQQVDKIAVWESGYVNTMEFTTLQIKNNIVVNGQITGEAFGRLLHVNYRLDI